MANQRHDPQSHDDAYRFDKDDSVTLIVGSGKEELLVHANYVARKSPFFKTALKREWREGQTRATELPEDDYETLTDYLHFIYSGNLATPFLAVNVLR